MNELRPFLDQNSKVYLLSVINYHVYVWRVSLVDEGLVPTNWQSRCLGSQRLCWPSHASVHLGISYRGTPSLTKGYPIVSVDFELRFW